MTQMGRFIPPDAQPGELGVHSVDHFSLNVPDLSVADHFYKSFGMDVQAESAKLGPQDQGPRSHLGHHQRERPQEPPLSLLRLLRRGLPAIPPAPAKDGHPPPRSASRHRPREPLVPRSRQQPDRDSGLRENIARSENFFLHEFHARRRPWSAHARRSARYPSDPHVPRVALHHRRGPRRRNSTRRSSACT